MVSKPASAASTTLILPCNAQTQIKLVLGCVTTGKLLIFFRIYVYVETIKLL